MPEKEKTVSILGDSISTYEGYNPEGYSIYYTPRVCRANGLNSASETWWAQVIRAMGAGLCVCGGYSGGRVSGTAFPAGCSPKRICDLATDLCTPDIILVYLGFNDFGYGVPIGEDAGDGQDLTCFASAYGAMVRRLLTAYPRADLLPGTLMRTRIRARDGWRFPERLRGIPLEDYSQVIRDTAASFGCRLMDLAGTGITYEPLDGTHPTRLGHAEIASAWVRCLKAGGCL